MMDWSRLGHIDFTWSFFFSLISIILIDLMLAGDNAVVIAMAVKTLPRNQRLKGSAFGAGAAVLLRVTLTFVAAQLLQIKFLKFAGGALILWIAVKLFIEGSPEEETGRQAQTLWQAIWIILVADITMSTDNVLAVAAASKGNLFLLLFGLALSIPFVVFTSNLLAMLMDKYPFLVYIGAAVLGRVGGEMLITDSFIVNLLHPSNVLHYGVQIFCTIGVIIAGKLWIRITKEKPVAAQVDTEA
jgi:YjbE family integral membrane protein